MDGCMAKHAKFQTDSGQESGRRSQNCHKLPRNISTTLASPSMEYMPTHQRVIKHRHIKKTCTTVVREGKGGGETTHQKKALHPNT